MKCIALNSWQYLDFQEIISDSELGSKFLNWYNRVNDELNHNINISISKVKTVWDTEHRTKDLEEAIDLGNESYTFELNGIDFYENISTDNTATEGEIDENKPRFNQKLCISLEESFTKTELANIFHIRIIEIPEGCKYYSVVEDDEFLYETIFFSETKIYKGE